MKKLAILFLLAAVTALSGCSGSNGGSSAQPQNNAPYAYDNASNGAGNAGDTDPVMYSVSVVVNYIENIAANKYSIRLYIDGEDYGMIEQGEQKSLSFMMSEGAHSIKVCENSDSTNGSTTTFFADKDGITVSFDVKAQWEGLNIIDSAQANTEDMLLETEVSLTYKENIAANIYDINV